jgi:phosphomannomutase
MGNSSFLENLKNAVDEGEFNSDAAKKINEIGTLSEEKFSQTSGSTQQLQSMVNKRLEGAEYKTVSPEEAKKANDAYNKRMNEIVKNDNINSKLALLIDFDNAVIMSINEMFQYLESVEEELSEDIKSEDRSVSLQSLVEKIDDIKNKYNNIKNG